MSKCIKTVVAVGIAVAVSVVAMANEVEQVNGAAGISGVGISGVGPLEMCNFLND